MNFLERVIYVVPECQVIVLAPESGILLGGSTKDVDYDEDL